MSRVNQLFGGFKYHLICKIGLKLSTFFDRVITSRTWRRLPYITLVLVTLRWRKYCVKINNFFLCLRFRLWKLSSAVERYQSIIQYCAALDACAKPCRCSILPTPISPSLPTSRREKTVPVQQSLSNSRRCFAFLSRSAPEQVRSTELLRCCATL